MSARLYGNEVNKTLRFQLGELLRDRTRNLLLLTATPHNGKNEDFLLFMSLLDPDRFAGRLRDDAKVPDVSDVMRRLSRRTCSPSRASGCSPNADAITVNYDLSPAEQNALRSRSLDYVRDGHEPRPGAWSRAATNAEASSSASRSPACSAGSPRRRRRSTSRCDAAASASSTQLIELQRLADGGSRSARSICRRASSSRTSKTSTSTTSTTRSSRISRTTHRERHVAPSRIAELEREVIELRLLGDARRAGARVSVEDRKWIELRDILQSDEFDTPGEPRKLIVFTEHKDTLNYLESEIRTAARSTRSGRDDPRRRASARTAAGSRTRSATTRPCRCSSRPTPPARASTCSART